MSAPGYAPAGLAPVTGQKKSQLWPYFLPRPSGFEHWRQDRIFDAWNAAVFLIDRSAWTGATFQPDSLRR